MIIKVNPSLIMGMVDAPASKSSMQRALAASLIRRGETRIHNPGTSNDDKAALANVQRLGAETEWTVEPNGSKILTVHSKGVAPVSDMIDCGESGLGIRMFTPITALSDREITVTGSGSLRTRPMSFFDEIFPRLGISVSSDGGRLPLVIRGPLQARDIEVDGSLSSQFLTGLLMAFSASGARGVTIRVKDLKSKPYIDLTLKVLKDFGWNVINRNHREFYFAGNDDLPTGTLDYRVEGDWSGGAFLLVAGAVAGDITVNGLDPESTQADMAVLTALRDAGADMRIGKEQIVIRRSELNAFAFDATECPDLFPPLVALAAFCKGTSVISGAGRLTHKESNRALTLQEEFGKMGVRILLEGDLMRIDGVDVVRAAETFSHHDHRIAMACAVAALRADGPVTISEAEAVNKSYPEFFNDLRSLGASVE